MGGRPDLVTGTGSSLAGRLPRRLARLRAGQLLGLLFLIGPLSDLADAGPSPAAKAAILASVGAFAALYMALLPPVGAIAGGGVRATGAVVCLLAGLAALALVLGAPRSFALLFVYVVAAAGVSLPAATAVGVTAVAAAGVGIGVLTAGAGDSTVAAWTLTVIGVGAVTTALGSAIRANEELRRMRDDRARLAVSAGAQLGLNLARTRILILTTFGRPGYLRRAVESGASGFLLKDAPATQLADAIREVHAGRRVIDPELAAAAIADGVSPLTERERDVLTAAAEHVTAAEIAGHLFLAEGTVRNYPSVAIRKLGARNRADAVRIARDKGWL